MRARLNLWLCCAAASILTASSAQLPCHEIQVVDQETGRGVPLVELATVNHLRFVTDSAGRVAFCEPGLENQTIAFTLKSHGYEFPKDGFGFHVARIKITEGGKTTLKIRRLNLAERLYRITGEGIYRDTLLLGHEPPIEKAILNAKVVGQDSTQAALYNGKIYWFWGDTSGIEYPLGNFRTTGATSDLSAKGGLDPNLGINLRYFTNKSGFTKEICPWEKSGLIWIDGLTVVADDSGRERLLCHFSHRESLTKELDHGLAIWNDEKNEFEKLIALDLSEKWRFPHGHPLKHTGSDGTHFYYGSVFRNVRVKADFHSITNPAAFQVFTCVSDKALSEKTVLVREASGDLVWSWKTKGQPVGPTDEVEWLKFGLMQPHEPRFLPTERGSTNRIVLHGGSIAWNPHRNRWIIIAVQIGGNPSMLGELFYLENDHISGPWTDAARIVSHDRYSFYNPIHHPFFNEDNGRRIYFEGTYTEAFSGNPTPTSRYDYNQVMYRLDLDKLKK